MHDTSRRIDTATRQQPEAAPAPTFTSSIVPSSFMLGGLKINVQFDYNMISSKKCIGEARYSDQLIILDPGTTPRQTVEQAFVHELTHWIFYMMNEDELRNNEKLVDLFAHFMYQVLSTAEPLPATADQQPAEQGE